MTTPVFENTLTFLSALQLLIFAVTMHHAWAIFFADHFDCLMERQIPTIGQTPSGM